MLDRWNVSTFLKTYQCYVLNIRFWFALQVKKLTVMTNMLGCWTVWVLVVGSSAPAACQSVFREAAEVLLCKWLSVDRYTFWLGGAVQLLMSRSATFCISEWMRVWIDKCVVKALWVVHLYKRQGHLPLRQNAGLLSGLHTDVPECIAQLKEKLQTVTERFG